MPGCTINIQYSFHWVLIRRAHTSWSISCGFESHKVTGFLPTYTLSNVSFLMFPLKVQNCRFSFIQNHSLQSWMMLKNLFLTEWDKTFGPVRSIEISTNQWLIRITMDADATTALRWICIVLPKIVYLLLLLLFVGSWQRLKPNYGNPWHGFGPSLTLIWVNGLNAIFD